jgi:hypothetical protein
MMGMIMLAFLVACVLLVMASDIWETWTWKDKEEEKEKNDERHN